MVDLVCKRVQVFSMKKMGVGGGGGMSREGEKQNTIEDVGLLHFF